MKRTKREQNSLIIGFTLNIIVFVLFIVWFILYIYPSFLEVEAKKSEVSNIINTLNRVKKDGINFTEFNLARKDLSPVSDTYLKKLVLKTDKNFFEENLTNTWSEDYLTFIEKLEQKLKINSLVFDEKQKKVDVILPLYSNKITLEDNYTLTDFKFVNYIERILQTFSLTYNNKIWIGELISIDSSSDSNTPKNKNDLSSKIFYIPIKLNIVWNKSDILNFLHYFEKVGSIEIGSGDIDIYNDKFIKKWSKLVRLEWDKFSKGYNIYFNQLWDIEYIKFKDYIDSSYKSREENESFVEFIERTQRDKKLKMEIWLRFYVKWLPDYKIKEYIQNFLSDYKEFKKYINSELKNKDLIKNKNTLTVSYLQKVNSVNSYLSSINNQTKEISKKLNSSKDLVSTYNEVIKENEIMKDIKIKIENEKKKLGIQK